MGREDKKLYQIGLPLAPWEDGEARPNLPPAGKPDSSGTEADGEWDSVNLSPGWENPIDLGGRGHSDNFQMDLLELSKRFAADLYVNGKKTAELELLSEDFP